MEALANYCFTYLIPFLIVLYEKFNMVPIIPSWMEAEVPTAQNILMHANVLELLHLTVTNIPFVLNISHAIIFHPLWGTWSIFQLKIWAWILPSVKGPGMTSGWFSQD